MTLIPQTKRQHSLKNPKEIRIDDRIRNRSDEYKKKKSDFQMEYVQERRQKFFDLHDHCIDCGSSEKKLQVIFVEPKNPKYGHRIWSLTPDKLNKELEKCRAICRSCASKRSAKKR